MSRSATEYSLRFLRSSGFVAGRTEYWQETPWSTEGPGVRRDLFYFCDLLAVGHGRILFVQTTSEGGMSDRWAKIIGSRPPKESLKLQGKKLAKAWREYDFIRSAVTEIFRVEAAEIVIHGWVKGQNKRPRERWVTAADLWEPPVEEQADLF